MAFSYINGRQQKYYLHSRVTQLRNARKQQIYFFSKTPEDGLDQIPAGNEVSEVKTSGLPVLKKQASG